MKVKNLMELLSELPEDASVELGKVIAVVSPDDVPTGTKIEAALPNTEHSAFEVILDFPICGIAYHEGDNDVRLIVEHADELSTFGKIKPLI